ncbi:hypothetical protein AB0J51_20370 [Micromonospora echinofusca]|uniref:hypothetical protein n=1 Tax=Micromonospora echinofusca TaxID=47858 RepID=UPI00343C1904
MSNPTRTRVLAALALAGALTTVGLAPAAPAAADGNPAAQWDAPPTCFKGTEVHWHNYGGMKDGTARPGHYEYIGETTERRFYGGGYETRHYWQYAVSIITMTGPYQADQVLVGWAKKHCGTTWHPYTA